MDDGDAVMSFGFLIIVTAALLGLGTSLVLGRNQARREAEAAQRKAAAEAETDLVRNRPREFITREGTRHRTRMAAWTHRRGIAQRVLDARTAAVAAMDKVPWRGASLGLRVLAAALVTALFVLSVLLNVQIFVALNGGITDFAAVAKGVGASLLELVLAVVASHLIRHRDFRSPAWQVRFWSTLALLGITVMFVYSYAPARSQKVLGPQVAMAERQLREAEATLLDNGQADPQAVSAAARTLADHQVRLHQAEASDQAQAVLFPLGEVLAGELALEGGVALIALARLRRGRRGVDEAQQYKDHVDEIINREELDATAQVVDALVRHGHTGVLGMVGQADGGRPAPPPPAGLPAPDPPNVGPAPADMTIDLDGISGPTQTSPNGATGTGTGQRPGPPADGPGPWDLRV